MPIAKNRRPVTYTKTTVFTGTGNYAMNKEAVLVVDKATGAATGVTLPKTPTKMDIGRTVTIKDGKGDAAAHNITITAPSSGTIDGASSLVLAENYAAAILTWNGAEWSIVQLLGQTAPGGITSPGLITGQAGLTVTGGAVNLNASDNHNTAINTGTSTGTVGIGNSAAGAVTIASGAASSFTVTGANLTLSTATSGTLAVTSAGLLNLTGVGASVWTPGDGATVVAGSTTGLTIGTATTQKLGFYNSTPVVQPASTGTTTLTAAGVGTALKNDSTTTGNTGSTAYTVADVVHNLKALGLLAA